MPSNDSLERWAGRILTAGFPSVAPPPSLLEDISAGRIGGVVVRVVVDRTFVDEDSVRWVVDYKTGRHEGGDLERFLDREQEHYRPQLERYGALVGALGAEPVRLALYFPVSGGWREWSPTAAP